MRGIYVPIDKAVLVELYVNRGMSIPDIAMELGTNIRVIHRRLIEHEIPRRNPGTRPAHGHPLPRPATILTPKFLVEAYQRKQMTTPQIAAATGFSVDSVTYYLRHAGIPIRGVRFVRRYDIERKPLVRLRRQGLTVKQIAARFGCSEATVERALRCYGIFPPTRPTLVDRIDPKRLAKLRKEGVTVAEIARRLGCSPRTVDRALQRYGIGR
jgi:DNA-binding CsgD family transcriptional regulator